MPFSGAKLKKIRESQDFTQMDLAQMIGSQPTQISRWERESSPPGTIYLERLAGALNVPITDLFEPDGAGEGRAA